MPFFQSPPELGNTYDDDDLLRRYLRLTLPKDALASIEGELSELGALSGGELYRASLATGTDVPELVPWDAWGHRQDHIELTPLWKQARRIAAEKGLVAAAYERKIGAYARVHQFAMVYLVEPSWAVYSCPLAMTDGAARTLLGSKNQALIDRAVPRLTSESMIRCSVPAAMLAAGMSRE